MKFLREAGLVVLAILLPVLLYAAANLTALNASFGNSEHIKRSLKKSNIYDNIVGTITDAVIDNSAQPGSREDGPPIDKAAIQQIAAQALPPEYLRNNTETVIDSLFRWIDGDVARPDFKIDLTDVKTRLADGVQTYALQRASTLPACTREQTAELAANEGIDPLFIPCRPPGVNLEAEIQKTVNELRASDQFLKDTEITAEDIKTESGANGEQVSVFENTKDLARILDLVRSSPIVLGILAALAATGVVFLSANRRQGIRRVAKILIATGAFLVIVSGLAQLAISRIGSLRPSQEDSASRLINDSVVPILRELLGELNRIHMLFGGAYILLGVITLVVLWQTGKRWQKKDVVADTPKAEPATEKSVTETEKEKTA